VLLLLVMANDFRSLFWPWQFPGRISAPAHMAIVLLPEYGRFSSFAEIMRTSSQLLSGHAEEASQSFPFR